MVGAPATPAPRSVTVTPGRTLPDSSTTLPMISPVVRCAATDVANPSANSTTAHARFMSPPQLLRRKRRLLRHGSARDAATNAGGIVRHRCRGNSPETAPETGESQHEFPLQFCRDLEICRDREELRRDVSVCRLAWQCDRHGATSAAQ